MKTNKINAEPIDFLDSYNSLIFVINSEIKKLNTMEIVKVVSVNKDENDNFNGTINVIPIVKRVDSEGVAVEESIIYEVKCFSWQYGDCKINAIPKENDIGLIVVSKRDITAIESGRVASNREFCLGDGVYFGGIEGFNQTPKNIIDFNQNGITITTEKDLTVNAKKEVVLNAEKDVNINADKDIKINGGKNVEITASDSVNVIATEVNLGGNSGNFVATVGGLVTTDGTPSGTTVGYIAQGSTIVKAV